LATFHEPFFVPDEAADFDDVAYNARLRIGHPRNFSDATPNHWEALIAAYIGDAEFPRSVDQSRSGRRVE
jgi:hypothetical protein